MGGGDVYLQYYTFAPFLLERGSKRLSCYRFISWSVEQFLLQFYACSLLTIRIRIRTAFLIVYTMRLTISGWIKV